MSQQNLELVRRINEAFNRGGFEPMFALADPPPEFEYAPSLAVGPDLVRAQRGREGFRRVVEGFWVVRDGRVVRWQGFADRKGALEAAGLRG